MKNRRRSRSTRSRKTRDMLPGGGDASDALLPMAPADAASLPLDSQFQSAERFGQALVAVTDPALVHLPLNILVQELLSRICHLLRTDTGAILLLTEDGSALALQAALGVKADEHSSHPLPVGRGVVGQIAARHMPLLVEDFSTIEGAKPMLRERLASLLGAPLLMKGEMIGVILVGTARTRHFTPADLHLLHLLADRAALAIEHVRLSEGECQAHARVLALQEAQKHQERVHCRNLEALNGVSLALLAEVQKEPLLSLIAQSARDLTGADFAAFTLRPPDGSSPRFHLAGSAGLNPEQKAVLRRIPLGGEGVLAPIYQERHLVRVADVPADPRSIGQPRGHPPVRSFLGAPLVARDGALLGGLLLGYALPGYFRSDHDSLLKGLAAQAVVALENAQLYEQLQQHAEELEAVLESLVDGVALHNAQGEVVRQNRASRELEATTGISLTRLLLEDLSEVRLCNPSGEPLAPEQRPTRRALAGETIRSADLRMRWASGQERELHVSAAPLHPSGNLEARVVTVLRDVTTQRQQEQAAQLYAEAEAQRRLLQTILDELPSGVFLVEAEKSRLVLANQAAQMIWGVRWPVGMPMRDFFQTAAVRIIQADGRPLPCDELPNLRVFHQEEPVRDQQLMIRQATAATLPVLVSAVKLPRFAQPEPRCATGEASGPLAAVVMQDISTLREAERLKDEFVALVSHELKNPLTNIKGYVQLLRFQLEDGYHAPVTQQERLCLQVVEEEVDRLAALASDVIDVARLQSGRMALQLDDVELVGLVRRVVEHQQMHAKAHVLQFRSAPNVLWMRADRQRLEQVLVNLVSNAIKYSPAGGFVKIRLTKLADSSQVQVSVRDQGIGIPRAQQAQLFGRFVRTTNAAAEAHQWHRVGALSLPRTHHAPWGQDLAGIGGGPGHYLLLCPASRGPCGGAGVKGPDAGRRSSCRHLSPPGEVRQKPPLLMTMRSASCGSALCMRTSSPHCGTVCAG